MTDLEALSEPGQSLIQEQLELENDMRTAGINRYREAFKKNTEAGKASLTKPWQTFIKHMVTPVAGAIRATIEEEQRGRASPRRANADILAEMDPMVIAAITLRKMIDILTADPRPTLQSLITNVGYDIETECAFAVFEEEMPALYKTAAKRASATNNIKFMRRAMRQAFVRVGSQWKRWEGDRVHAVGFFCVSCVIDERVLCEQFKAPAPKKGLQDFVRLLPEAAKWVAEFNSRAENLAPVWMPMIIPPAPWTPDCPGGYLTGPTMPNYGLITGQAQRKRRKHNELVDWDRAEDSISAINPAIK